VPSASVTTAWLFLVTPSATTVGVPEIVAPFSASVKSNAYFSTAPGGLAGQIHSR
jgi:hypothetical protein